LGSFALLLNDEAQNNLLKIELFIKAEGRCYRSNEASRERALKHSYCFGLSDPRQTKASDKSPLQLCQIPDLKCGRESAWVCWKGQSPKGGPAADRWCKVWKSACTGTIKDLLVVPLQTGKSNCWHRIPVYAGQVWHYWWTSQGRRLIKVREQRGKTSISKMFEDILKFHPHSPHTLSDW